MAIVDGDHVFPASRVTLWRMHVPLLSQPTVMFVPLTLW
jgi:hypothetical protein